MQIKAVFGSLQLLKNLKEINLINYFWNKVRVYILIRLIQFLNHLARQMKPIFYIKIVASKKNSTQVFLRRSIFYTLEVRQKKVFLAKTWDHIETFYSEEIETKKTEFRRQHQM